MVDTSDQTPQIRVQRTTHRRRTIQERRAIVEETLLSGASVSRVARRHDVNANQVFYWRKLYREGKLGSRTDAQLVPVKVADDQSVDGVKEDDFLPRSGTLEIKLAKGTIRLAGNVDVVVLRAAIECLVG
ncbi:MAG TPA: transposase [Candidatus Acidoferrum sp.]|nr:transposase [Candidatus Acidoferrum sp.]